MRLAKLFKSPAIQGLELIDDAKLTPFTKLQLLLVWRTPRLGYRALKYLDKWIKELERLEAKK